MSILVECTCGKQVMAKDEYAGRRYKCQTCGMILTIPQRSVFIPNESLVQPVETAATETNSETDKRPFWKDPVVVVGAALPTVILLVFLGYLYRERNEKIFQERILAWKVKADDFVAKDQTVQAFDAYAIIVTAAEKHPTSDSQTLAIFEIARRAKSKLEPLALAEKQAAKAALEEMQRIAKAKAEKEADLLRLSKLTTRISGDAWVVNGRDEPRARPGLEIILLKTWLLRSEIDDILKKAVFLAAFNRGFNESVVRNDSSISEDRAREILEQSRTVESQAKQLSSFNPTDTVDTKELYKLIRLTALGNKRDKILKDDLWPEVIKRCIVAKVNTNFKGHYTIPDVKGGEYYLYSMHFNDVSIIEWMFEVRLDKNEITCDVYNEKASLIINSKD